MVLNKPTKVWNKRSVLEPLHLNEILARMLLQGIPPFTKIYAALLAQFNPKIDNRKVSCSWDMLQLIASLIPSMCIKPVFFFNHLTLHGHMNVRQASCLWVQRKTTKRRSGGSLSSLWNSDYVPEAFLKLAKRTLCFWLLRTI